MVEDLHPDARKVVLVTDNLNVHDPGSLYEAFDLAKARRIVEKLEWHYTPKHGSCLNVAECKLATLSAQCLNRKIGSAARFGPVVETREERNKRQIGMAWQFTTAKARTKLKRLYPVPQMR